MDKPSYKLVGAPCGQHGQYTFYKAIRLTGSKERIVAIGDFFFVRIWQDSELVSIGELQLLWTDRVSDQTLVSLRLYFLPENTPDGRSLHGEDEVLAINDKVVLRAEELLSWVCSGSGWRWGLRAVWRGACAPPAEPRHSAPLHHTKLDFSDVEREKSSITVDVDEPGVVVFSYPRYCRYRALVARLEDIQAAWLRDSLVAALGGYAAPTRNTRILYCKDTFEYPELEGHEFVCNHLAPKLKGRPRGRRRRAARSRDRSPDQSPDSRSSDSDAPETRTLRRISLRNGPEKNSEDEEPEKKPEEVEKDEEFMKQLKAFHKEKNDTMRVPRGFKHVSLRSLYSWVWSCGGFAAACRAGAWRERYREHAPALRRIYERYLLQYENHERWNGRKYPKMNGKTDEPKTIDTIDVTDSPSRENSDNTELPQKTLRTPSPKPENLVLDNETGEITKDLNITSKPAEELNREFLESLPKEEKPAKIYLKPFEELIEPGRRDASGTGDRGHALNLGNPDRFLHLSAPDSLRSLSSLGDKYTNGHIAMDQKPRSSLRAVRVKTTRAPPTAPTTPGPLLADSSPPHAFGMLHPAMTDDDIVEVPYKPKSPEIIDLDEYPESPPGLRSKKLDILKERGLQVTAVPAPGVPGAPGTPGAPGALGAPVWPPGLNPIQHQIMAQASIFQMYNILPKYPNGVPAPKVIQAASAFGCSGPEKTVYGNPKDPFMPAPHMLLGTPIKPQRSVPAAPLPRDILDLTCKAAHKAGHKPAVEIVRVPGAPSPSTPSNPSNPSNPQNLSKNYTLVDGKAVVGSNLEITLVNKSQSPRKAQKRSSNGKFISSRTPPKSPPRRPSPAHEPPKGAPPYMEPYNLLLRAPGLDPRQLALYRDLMSGQLRYPGLLTPTTKN